MILLERVRKAKRARDKAEATFIEALKAARPVHSLAEIADAAGLSRQGVRYFTNDENERRRARKKGGDDE
jgi:hypothetical protein